MKPSPLVTFSAIAIAALGALGGAVYVSRTPEVLKPAAAVPEKPVEAPKPVAVAPVVEAPVVEQPKQIAVAQPEAAPVKPVAEVIALASPSFDAVRVEPTGEAVIAGHADPGAEVTVKYNGAVVGKATANADGSFAIVPDKPLAEGTGALTLEMAKNGEIVASAGSVVVAVKKNAPAMVAKINPVEPTTVTQAAAPAAGAVAEVQLNAVDYDPAGNIVFSGRATPESVVRFYVDNALVGETKADVQGQWRFAGASTIAAGTHTLRADAIDAAGKVASRVELPFLREEVAKVVAAAEPVAITPPEVATAPAATTPETPVVVAAAEAPPIEAIQKIVIQPGNSLWKISRQVYGKGRMFTVIYEANRDQLRNPNKIYPGQILTAPKQN